MKYEKKPKRIWITPRRNEKQWQNMKRDMEMAGWEVHGPAMMQHNEETLEEELLPDRIAEMLICTRVMLLVDWTHEKSSRIEREVALTFNKQVDYLADMEDANIVEKAMQKVTGWRLSDIGFTFKRFRNQKLSNFEVDRLLTKRLFLAMLHKNSYYSYARIGDLANITGGSVKSEIQHFEKEVLVIPTLRKKMEHVQAIINDMKGYGTIKKRI